MHKAIRVSFVAIVLILALIASFIAYSHWSLRQLPSDLPTNKALFDLLSVEGGPTSIRYITTASMQDKRRGEVIFPAFVLQWADGRRFVIDAGMDEQGADDFYQKLSWQYKSDGIHAHGSVAKQLGEAVTSVAGLGFTHLHEDHVQGIQSYCQPNVKKLPLYQTPQQAQEANYTTMPGIGFVEKATCVEQKTLEGTGTIYKVPGFPGLAAIQVAGHSPGSTVFVANINGKLWIMAGDVSWQRDALLANQPKKVSFSRTLIIPEDEKRLSELRLWLSQLEKDSRVNVLLCHDSLALQQYGPQKFTSSQKETLQAQF